MIWLNGKELYQWDTGRSIRLVGEEDVDEVHFANERDVAYTVKVDDPSCVRIPNKLLTMERPILVYIYVKDSEKDEEYTKKRRCFQVLARPRPDSYVDDEVEMNATLKSLDERLSAIEILLNSGTDGQILTKVDGMLTWQ